MLDTNVELNPVIEQFVTTCEWEQEHRNMPQHDTPYFDVSVKSATKLLYPLIYAEFEKRGYSETHIKYRLWRAQDCDCELVDCIETILSDFEEDFNN